jgi:hypothetical protein
MKLKIDRVREPLGAKEENSVRERFKQDLIHSKSDVQYIEVEEYFVKYRNFSYLHCEWKTEDELFKGDKRISAKLKRFKQKMAHHANIFENVSSCLRWAFCVRYAILRISDYIVVLHISCFKYHWHMMVCGGC